MKRIWIIAVFFLAFVFSGFVQSCKPQTPSEFISEGEMEDILYDYHLSEALARENTDAYGTTLIAYRTAVLKKYGVTQEKFDTSMVYYMRHTDRLHAMYERIAKRMEDKAQEYGSSVSLSGMGRVTANGDTVDIWKGPKNIALIPNQPFNIESFSYKADSSYHRGDSFILTMTSNFIFQDGSRDGIAQLVVVFQNDSVASNVFHISSASQQTVRVDNADSLGIKEIKGFFMLNMNNQANSSTTTLHLMTLGNIHLYRCHPQSKKKPFSPKSVTPPPDSMRKSTQRLRETTVKVSNVDTMKSRPIQK
ncbi:MAG: DUF4296 domain-containing protein [Prevotella sp.]|nr:DUF4296 domain-containing protein [Prevotella sp.]